MNKQSGRDTSKKRAAIVAIDLAARDDGTVDHPGAVMCVMCWTGIAHVSELALDRRGPMHLRCCRESNRGPSGSTSS